MLLLWRHDLVAPAFQGRERVSRVQLRLLGGQHRCVLPGYDCSEDVGLVGEMAGLRLAHTGGGADVLERRALDAAGLDQAGAGGSDPIPCRSASSRGPPQRSGRQRISGPHTAKTTVDRT